MLTNFISEATNQIVYPPVESSAGDLVGEQPVIRRKIKIEESPIESVDIYERAREIYYRSRRTYGSSAPDMQ